MATKDKLVSLEVLKNTTQADVNDLKSASDEVLEILEHPISYSKSDVPMSAYFTTIIDGVQLIAGTRYDISATLASAATQAYYLLLYKGETSVASITIASGSTTGTFYYDVTETGDDYSIKAASGAYAAHVGVSATVVPRTSGSRLDIIENNIETEDTKQKAITSLLHNTTERRYLSSNMFDGEYVSSASVSTSGVVIADNNYGYTKNLIRVKAGDTISISDGSAIRSMRVVTAYDADYNAVSAKGAESTSLYTVPSGVDYIRITAAIGYFGDAEFAVQNSSVMLAYDEYSAKDVPISAETYYDTHYIASSNMFNGQYVSGHGIKADGTLTNDNTYGYTDFIQVDAGDNICVASNHGTRLMRLIAAYDKHYQILPAKGTDTPIYTYWTVPDGVYYIRITAQVAVLSATDCAIYRSQVPALHVKDTLNIVTVTDRNAYRMKHYEPLRFMPDWMTDTLSYRPLGQLSKGYICMTTDDGTSGLATYTIPMAIQKGVPFTFAVMKDSEVFADNTMKATVLDAVNNHGCSLMQHGGIVWDTLSERDLNNFFDIEKAFFDQLGVEVKGAAPPQIRMNSLVKAVCGARFGVVRGAYYGFKPGSDGDVRNDSVSNYYDYYTSGERSNVYGLSGYNCAFTTTAYNHSAVDYAKANNKILIVYYHEFDLDADKKAVIEDLIDYAKAQGLEFITIGDIPSLETWDGVTS